MPSFDEIAPNFLRAKNRWPDAPTLSDHYAAVVNIYDNNGHGLIDAVKSFIECVCLTILGDFGKTMPSATPDISELLSETLKTLNLKNNRGANKLDKVLSAHNKLANALREMRNEAGPIAHGKDGFLDSLTSNHQRVFLLTGDTLLSLLMAALEGKDPDIQFTREPYERFFYLHPRIDDSVTVESVIEEQEDQQVIVLTMRSSSLPDGIELRVEPSRLLYSIDRTAYLQLLDASTVKVATPIAEESVEAPPIPPFPESEGRATVPLVATVSSYEGVLSRFEDSLKNYLGSLGISVSSTQIDGVIMIMSLLRTAEANMGTDWIERENMQASMKVALRRVLLRFDVNDKVAKDAAEHLVSWFRIQMTGFTNSAGEQSDVH